MRMLLTTLGIFMIALFASTVIAEEVIWQEDFESGWGDWYPDNGVWQIENGIAATDIENNYPQYTDSRLISPSINLPTLEENEEIQLRLLTWHSYQSADFGQVNIRVEVDSSWTGWINIGNQLRMTSNVKSQYSVDLSPYAGKLVQIGLYHEENDNDNPPWDYQGPGWFIDTIILWKGIPSFSSKELESFNNGWGDWYTDNGVWEINENEEYAITINDQNYPQYTDSRLISPSFMLEEGTDNLDFRFEHKYSFAAADYGKIQISFYENEKWGDWIDVIDETIDELILFGQTSLVWTPYLVSINASFFEFTNFDNKRIRIAFSHYDNDNDNPPWDYQDIGWSIDNINIKNLKDRTIQPLLPPILEKPDDKSIIKKGTEIELSWISYPIQPTYYLNINDVTEIISNATSYLFDTTFLTNGVHEWKVKSENANGNQSLYSSTRELLLDYPETPLLGSPKEIGITSGNTISFRWNPVENAGYYNLIVIDPYGKTLVDKKLSNDILLYIPEDSKTWEIGSYIWKVRAIKTAPEGYDQSVYDTVVGWSNFEESSFTIRDDEIIIFENSVFVYDTPFGNDLLNGSTDYDNNDDRALLITWDAPSPKYPEDQTDWHVYVQTDIYGYFFLGNTGSGSKKSLLWAKDSSDNLAANMKNGPAFGHTYRFQVFAIRPERKYYLATQDGPIGYTSTGSDEMPIFIAEPPTLTEETAVITDDIFDIDNITTDIDTTDSQAICLKWNVGQIEQGQQFWNYHIKVSVNGGEEEFLGQTGSNTINYFRWSNIPLFSTELPFMAGPQDGESYVFTIYGLLPGSGGSRKIECGPLQYSLLQ
jgi:hypothetical protein